MSAAGDTDTINVYLSQSLYVRIQRPPILTRTAIEKAAGLPPLSRRLRDRQSQKQLSLSYLSPESDPSEFDASVTEIDASEPLGATWYFLRGLLRRAWVNVRDFQVFEALQPDMWLEMGAFRGSTQDLEHRLRYFHRSMRNWRTMTLALLDGLSNVNARGAWSKMREIQRARMRLQGTVRVHSPLDPTAKLSEWTTKDGSVPDSLFIQKSNWQLAAALPQRSFEIHTVYGLGQKPKTPKGKQFKVVDGPQLAAKTRRRLRRARVHVLSMYRKKDGSATTSFPPGSGGLLPWEDLQVVTQPPISAENPRDDPLDPREDSTLTFGRILSKVKIYERSTPQGKHQIQSASHDQSTPADQLYVIILENDYQVQSLTLLQSLTSTVLNYQNLLSSDSEPHNNVIQALKSYNSLIPGNFAYQYLKEIVKQLAIKIRDGFTNDEDVVSFKKSYFVQYTETLLSIQSELATVFKDKLSIVTINDRFKDVFEKFTLAKNDYQAKIRLLGDILRSTVEPTDCQSVWLSQEIQTQDPERAWLVYHVSNSFCTSESSRDIERPMQFTTGVRNFDYPTELNEQILLKFFAESYQASDFDDTMITRMQWYWTLQVSHDKGIPLRIQSVSDDMRNIIKNIGEASDEIQFIAEMFGYDEFYSYLSLLVSISSVWVRVDESVISLIPLFLSKTDRSNFIDLRLIPELEERQANFSFIVPDDSKSLFDERLGFLFSKLRPALTKYFQSAWEYCAARASLESQTVMRLWNQLGTLLPLETDPVKEFWSKFFTQIIQSFLSEIYLETSNFDVTSASLEKIEKQRDRTQETLKVAEELDAKYPEYKLQRDAMSFSVDLQPFRNEIQTLQIELDDFANRRQRYINFSNEVPNLIDSINSVFDILDVDFLTKLQSEIAQLSPDSDLDTWRLATDGVDFAMYNRLCDIGDFSDTLPANLRQVLARLPVSQAYVDGLTFLSVDTPDDASIGADSDPRRKELFFRYRRDDCYGCFVRDENFDKELRQAQPDDDIADPDTASTSEELLNGLWWAPNHRSRYYYRNSQPNWLFTDCPAYQTAFPFAPPSHCVSPDVVGHDGELCLQATPILTKFNAIRPIQSDAALFGANAQSSDDAFLFLRTAQWQQFGYLDQTEDVRDAGTWKLPAGKAMEEAFKKTNDGSIRSVDIMDILQGKWNEASAVHWISRPLSLQRHFMVASWCKALRIDPPQAQFEIPAPVLQKKAGRFYLLSREQYNIQTVALQFVDSLKKTVDFSNKVIEDLANAFHNTATDTQRKPFTSTRDESVVTYQIVKIRTESASVSAQIPSSRKAAKILGTMLARQTTRTIQQQVDFLGFAGSLSLRTLRTTLVKISKAERERFKHQQKLSTVFNAARNDDKKNLPIETMSQRNQFVNGIFSDINVLFQLFLATGDTPQKKANEIVLQVVQSYHSIYRLMEKDFVDSDLASCLQTLNASEKTLDSSPAEALDQDATGPLPELPSSAELLQMQLFFRYGFYQQVLQLLVNISPESTSLNLESKKQPPLCAAVQEVFAGLRNVTPLDIKNYDLQKLKFRVINKFAGFDGLTINDDLPDNPGKLDGDFIQIVTTEARSTLVDVADFVFDENTAKDEQKYILLRWSAYNLVRQMRFVVETIKDMQEINSILKTMRKSFVFKAYQNSQTRQKLFEDLVVKCVGKDSLLSLVNETLDKSDFDDKRQLLRRLPTALELVEPALAPEHSRWQSTDIGVFGIPWPFRALSPISKNGATKGSNLFGKQLSAREAIPRSRESASTTSAVWNLASPPTVTYLKTSESKWSNAQWNLKMTPTTQFQREHPRQATELSALLCRYIFARYRRILECHGPPLQYSESEDTRLSRLQRESTPSPPAARRISHKQIFTSAVKQHAAECPDEILQKRIGLQNPFNQPLAEQSPKVRSAQWKLGMLALRLQALRIADVAQEEERTYDLIHELSAGLTVSAKSIALLTRVPQQRDIMYVLESDPWPTTVNRNANPKLRIAFEELKQSIDGFLTQWSETRDGDEDKGFRLALQLHVVVREALQSAGILASQDHNANLDKIREIQTSDTIPSKNIVTYSRSIVTGLNSFNSQTFKQVNFLRDPDANPSSELQFLVNKLRADDRPLSLENIVALAHVTNVPLATLLPYCVVPESASSVPLESTSQTDSNFLSSLNPAFNPDLVQGSGQPKRAILALNAIQEQYRARAQARVLARMECNRAFGTDVGATNRTVLTVEDMGRVDRLVLQKQQLSRLLESPEATIERLPAVHCVLSVYPSVDVRTFKMDFGHVEELPRQEFSPNSATDRRQPLLPNDDRSALVWVGYQILPSNVGSSNLPVSGRWNVRISTETPETLSPVLNPYFIAFHSQNKALRESVETWISLAMSAVSRGSFQETLRGQCGLRLLVIKLPLPRWDGGNLKPARLKTDSVETVNVQIKEVELQCQVPALRDHSLLHVTDADSLATNDNVRVDDNGAARASDFFTRKADAGGAVPDPTAFLQALFNENGDTLALISSDGSQTPLEPDERILKMQTIMQYFPGFNRSCLRRIVDLDSMREVDTLAEAGFVQCCSATLLDQLRRLDGTNFFGPPQRHGAGFVMKCGRRSLDPLAPQMQLALYTMQWPQWYTSLRRMLRVCYPALGGFDALVFSVIGSTQRPQSTSQDPGTQEALALLRRLARQGPLDKVHAPWKAALLESQKPEQLLKLHSGAIELARTLDLQPTFTLSTTGATLALSMKQLLGLLWQNFSNKFYNPLPEPVPGIDTELFPEARPSWRVTTHADVAYLDEEQQKLRAARVVSRLTLKLRPDTEEEFRVPFNRLGVALMMRIRTESDTVTSEKVQWLQGSRTEQTRVHADGLLGLLDEEPQVYFKPLLPPPLLSLQPLQASDIEQAWANVTDRWSSDSELRSLKSDLNQAGLYGCQSPYSSYVARFVLANRRTDLQHKQRQNAKEKADPILRDQLAILESRIRDLEALPVRLELLLDDGHGPLPRVLT